MVKHGLRSRFWPFFKKSKIIRPHEWRNDCMEFHTSYYWIMYIPQSQCSRLRDGFFVSLIIFDFLKKCPSLHLRPCFTVISALIKGKDHIPENQSLILISHSNCTGVFSSPAHFLHVSIVALNDYFTIIRL